MSYIRKIIMGLILAGTLAACDGGLTTEPIGDGVTIESCQEDGGFVTLDRVNGHVCNYR